MTDDAPYKTPATPHSSIDLTRHEEQLRVSTERLPVETVRIERVVVTEQRTITVEVSHEEVRITREPITESSTPVASAPQQRAPIVMILREERIDITKSLVPVEKITLHVDTVTVDQIVTEDVRLERIDYESPAKR